MAPEIECVMHLSLSLTCGVFFEHAQIQILLWLY